MAATLVGHARRTAVAIGAVLAAACASPVGPPAPVVGTVGTGSGRVQGVTLDSGVQAWLGVPYVQAPVRERRWRAPEPIAWDGVYHADRTMPQCPQVLRPHDINHYFGEEATSEDCLYMNIWAPPGAGAGDSLPVVVFLYGGGMTVGSSGMALYGGEAVAARGAVFVNFNYRLGLLGLMAHPELTAESGRGASGNWAYLDMVAALEWIQRNIAQFGGDPAKVVVSGQSAGAGAVSLLQVSPLAEGLFRGVVAMSGGTWRDGGQGGVSLAEAEAVGQQVQALLGAASLAELRDVPADRIHALQTETQLGAGGRGPVRVGTSIDGHFLPATPAAIVAAGGGSDVPVIAGFANNESRHAVREAATAEEYRAVARATFGAQADAFLALYPVGSDAEVAEVANAVAREGGVMRTARNWARIQGTAMTSPVFLYNLQRVHPFNPAALAVDRVDLVGAYHTSDVPYWFGTLEAFNLFRPMRLWTGADRDLSAQLIDALVAFADTGSPTTPAIPWRAWTPGEEGVLEIGSDGVRMGAMATARLDFMAQAADSPPVPPPGPEGMPRD
jgi:para-nitrobenzyl esterase